MTKSLHSYGRHIIDDDDIRAVTDILKGDWLTTGPVSARFEAAFLDRVGARHAVACSSGTAALHLAAMALDLGPGDEVIVPAMTFVATANAVRFIGAEVILADVDPDSGLLTEATLDEAISRAKPERLKAIFPVHLNGQAVDMAAVADAAERTGAAVVEDACHALGTSYETPQGAVTVGDCSHGDMAVFSFHPMKTLTTGEGGMITTREARHGERIARLRSHGIERAADAFENPELAIDGQGRANPWYHEMQELGFNYRASDIHCALGLSQLGKLDNFVQRRHELMELYDRRLANLAPLIQPVDRRACQNAAWHLNVVLIDFEEVGISRGDLMRALRERGIASQVHYLPVHMHPYYRRRYGDISLPSAEAYYARALSIPLHPGMRDEDVDEVVSALESLIGIPA